MPKPRDIGNEETERLLKQLEKRVTEEYSQAAKEVDAKFKDYMRRFEIKDKIKREAVAAGVLDKKDYIAWRQSQVMVGDKWQALLNDMSHDLTNAREIAISTAQGYREDAYAINHNFATYQIESQAQINTSYTLYDRQTVERLMREDPKLLPDPRPGGKTARMLAENKELRWNRQKLTSAVAQGIIQGESVPQMTKRLESVAAMDHRAAIRNVRTMVTGAQNAGRMDAAKRARDMGIGLTNVWMATLDMRTRHEHRVLDGQRREIDEPFEVEGEKIKYPGDPDAPAHLVYNCRCTLVQQVKGFEYDIRGDKDVDYSGIEGMTYDEWKEDRREKPNPITLPEEKAEAIKQSYNAEYRKLRKDTEEQLAKSENGGIINSGGFTGAKKTPGWEDRHAELMYEEIRHRTNDAKRISSHTIFKESAVEEIRQHVFIEKHHFEDGRYERFLPDFEQAQAWERLARGEGTVVDLELLKHEYVELTQIRLHGYVYEQAHEIANKKHNWWAMLMESRNAE